jgi:hypothetical protein
MITKGRTFTNGLLVFPLFSLLLILIEAVMQK